MASPSVSGALPHPSTMRLFVEIIHAYGVTHEQLRVQLHHYRCAYEALQGRADDLSSANRDLQSRLDGATACEDVKQRIIDQQTDLIHSLDNDLRQKLRSSSPSPWPPLPPLQGTIPAPASPARPTSSASTIILHGNGQSASLDPTIIESIEVPAEKKGPRKRKAAPEMGRAANKAQKRSEADHGQA
jgi:hypothetical protein